MANPIAHSTSSPIGKGKNSKQQHARERHTQYGKAGRDIYNPCSRKQATAEADWYYLVYWIGRYTGA